MNQQLEQEVGRLHAGICGGLADPTRILIIYELAGQPRNVTQLANALRLSQPLVSRHLKVLRERGMVLAVRRGPSVEYSLGDYRLVEAMDLLRAVLRDQIGRRVELMDMWA